MKRCVSILTLILAIIFTGCTQSTTPDVTQNPTFPTESVEDVTTAPPEETTDIEDMLLHPLYSISLYDTEEITESGNGSEVFKFVHQNIVLILPEPEISNKIIIDFVNEENAIATHAEAAAQDALQAYADGELTTPHLLQSKYSAYRLDESVLSLYGEAVSFTGGAHSVYTGQSLNYDTLTGKRLSLSDVFNETFTVEIMREMIQHQLNVFYKDLLFEGYETLLTSFVPDDLSECTNWFFTEGGLCLYFAPGEFGPYTAGVLYASISYSNLTGYLLDAYFPPETMPGYRDMKAQTFNTEELTEYERFSELILNAGSTKILLSASAPVYDVKIMDYSSFGHSIKQVMYAAYALSPNDAILLEADFEKTKLVISYRNANGTQACLIHVDGDTVTLEPI